MRLLLWFLALHLQLECGPGANLHGLIPSTSIGAHVRSALGEASCQLHAMAMETWPLVDGSAFGSFFGNDKIKHIGFPSLLKWVGGDFLKFFSGGFLFQGGMKPPTTMTWPYPVAPCYS